MVKKTEIDDLNEKLKDYQSKGYNIPGTTVIMETADFMRPVIRIVQVNAIIPEGKTSNDDIYSVGGGKFAFGRSAIQNFADAGRIDLRVPLGATRVEKGPNIDRYIAAVVGERYESDGSLKRLEDQKSLDLVIRSEELRIKCRDKVDKDHPRWSPSEKQEYVERYMEKVRIEKHKFAMECAITGAQARVVTKLLGLKPAYTLAELRKPFVIVSMQIVVNMQDVDIKRMVTAHMLGIKEAIYPQSAQSGYVSHPAAGVGEVASGRETALESLSIGAPVVAVHKAANIVDGFDDYPRAMKEAILKRLLGTSSLTGRLGEMEDPELAKLYGDLKAAA